MLTQKTIYAIHALLELAENFGNEPVQISQIAESRKIPKRFLETILLELKKNGYLDSRLGKNGGYFLIRGPQQVNLLEIIRLFEGAIALIACVSEKHYRTCDHCEDEKNCAIKLTFKDIREYTYKKLAATNLASLIELGKHGELIPE